MLDTTALNRLIAKHKKTLLALRAVEEALNGRFLHMERHTRALVLAVASGEPLLLVGPPGTAKSRLVRSFCGILGLLDEDAPDRRDASYFEYLLTPFTEPGELFGFYDVAAMRKGDLKRMDDGMMQKARVVFLDEIFNASSAILNSILTFMNERLFHDRGTTVPVVMECMFGATNDTPKGSELKAVFDRFLLRSRVENEAAEPGNLRDLVARGWQETYAHHRRGPDGGDLLAGLRQLRADLGSEVDAGHLSSADTKAFYGNLAFLVKYAREAGASSMSNRRVVKMSYVMTLHRMYRAVVEDHSKPEELTMGAEELALLPAYFLDAADPRVIEKMGKLPYPMG